MRFIHMSLKIFTSKINIQFFIISMDANSDIRLNSRLHICFSDNSTKKFHFEATLLFKTREKWIRRFSRRKLLPRRYFEAGNKQQRNRGKFSIAAIALEIPVSFEATLFITRFSDSLSIRLQCLENTKHITKMLIIAISSTIAYVSQKTIPVPIVSHEARISLNKISNREKTLRNSD